MSDPTQVSTQRSLGGLVFTGTAVAAIVTMLVVWLGSMYFMKQGRPAEGPRTTIEIASCAEAQPLLQQRVEAIGLGEPVFAGSKNGTWTVTADLTGDEAVDARIPDVLATTGRFSVRLDGEEIVGPERITQAVTQVDYYANPELLIELDRDGASALLAAMKQDAERTLEYVLDGQVIGTRPTLPPIEDGRIKLEAQDPRSRQGIQTMAEWSISIPYGPLPCDARVSRIEPAAD